MQLLSELLSSLCIIIITRPGAHTITTGRVCTNGAYIYIYMDGKYKHKILDLEQTIAYCYWTDRGRRISKSAIELRIRRSYIKLVANTLYRLNFLCTPTGKAVK